MLEQAASVDGRLSRRSGQRPQRCAAGRDRDVKGHVSEIGLRAHRNAGLERRGESAAGRHRRRLDGAAVRFLRHADREARGADRRGQGDAGGRHEGRRRHRAIGRDGFGHAFGQAAVANVHDARDHAARGVVDAATHEARIARRGRPGACHGLEDTGARRGRGLTGDFGDGAGARGAGDERREEEEDGSLHAEHHRAFLAAPGAAAGARGPAGNLPAPRIRAAAPRGSR